jgi:RimJ/RimL family protein N-acetyltransferase
VHRGRGLATLAKRASLVRAAQLGITAVYTGNDVTNEAMQAINRNLGYEPCSTMLSWARNLVEA